MAPSDDERPSIIEFWAARLAEDERVAKTATSGPWREIGMSIRGETRMNRTDVLVVRHTWPQESAHIVRHDPARVLREVERDRQIMADYQRANQTPVGSYGEPDDQAATRIALERVARLCVAVWSDHPDYRAEEWAP